MVYILRLLQGYFDVSDVYIFYKSSLQNNNLRARELHYFTTSLPYASDSIIAPFEAASGILISTF
jgi:hypothetical protein